MNVPRSKGARSEVFLRGDIGLMLRGLAAAQTLGGEYGRGFSAALYAAAVAFGVEDQLDAAAQPPRMPQDAIRLGVPETNFEAALRGLGPPEIAALAEIKRAVGGSEPEQRQKILDGYLDRIRSGWTAER